MNPIGRQWAEFPEKFGLSPWGITLPWARIAPRAEAETSTAAILELFLTNQGELQNPKQTEAGQDFGAKSFLVQEPGLPTEQRKKHELSNT